MIRLQTVTQYFLCLSFTITTTYSSYCRFTCSCLPFDFANFYTKDCCTKNENNNNNIDTEQSVPYYSVYNAKGMSSNSGYHGLYRPRSALARALYEKQRNDRYLEEIDQNEWYKVDFHRLNDEMKLKFVQLGPDEETKQFLNKSIDKSSWVWTQIWYLMAKAVLKHFWSTTDINGWLGRGYMHVLSQEQTKTLLQKNIEGHTRQSIVDIGAGDGEVSQRIASLYADRYATEISSKMRNVLIKKGFKILDTYEWWRGQQFDCVCMLNLVDRCSRPVSMLREARTAITPGGIIMLALVLPYKPYVEVNADHKPEEWMPINGLTFEEQAESFVVFMKEIGFELVSWSRVPYLCEGDFTQAYYWLDDSVYVFKPITIMSSST